MATSLSLRAYQLLGNLLWSLLYPRVAYLIVIAVCLAHSSKDVVAFSRFSVYLL